MSEVAEPLENPKPMGRPGIFSQEIADTICELMATGKGLREICTREDMPGRTTVLRWLEADEKFRGQYARARIHLMDWYAEEIVRIAYDETGDILIDQDGDKSRTVANHAKVQRDKLKIEALKWLMSKLAPKRFGNTPEDLAPADLHPINKIELVGVPSHPDRIVVSWEDRTVGDLMKEIDGRTRSVDPAAKRSAADDEPRELRQITFQPTPPPADLSPEAWSAIARVSDLIERIAPGDEKPETVFGLIEGFLHAHYCV